MSFMVLHNLDIASVEKVFKEVSRVLKDGGQSVFLTMHPEILDSEKWDLDFWKYDEKDIENYRNTKDKEGVAVKGWVKNISGEDKPVIMYNHTRENMEKAIKDSGLNIMKQQDIWIDEKTAIDKFGENSVKKIPTKPAFWMITVEKKIRRL